MDPGAHTGGQRRMPQLPRRLLHYSTSPDWNEPTDLLESVREVSWTHLQRVTCPGQREAGGSALLTGSPVRAGLWKAAIATTLRVTAGTLVRVPDFRPRPRAICLCAPAAASLPCRLLE